MRISLRSYRAFFTLVPIATALLIMLSGAANAKSPKVGYHTIFDEIVEADPGEDPHMKVDPLVDPGLILDSARGNFPIMVDYLDILILGQQHTTGYIAGIQKIFIKTKLKIRMQIPSGSLFN